MKLVLVYNADEGIFNAITDTIHKVMSPQTYECRLCQFTHGMTGMLKRWKQFIESLPNEKEFLHRNEFRRMYPDAEAAIPAIFLEEDGNLRALVSSDEINICENLEELIELVDERLKRYQKAEVTDKVG